MPKSAEEKWKGKNREVNLGLANNLFGAGAGGVATGMAWKARKHDPTTMMPKPEPPKASRVGRALKRIPGVSPKAAAIGAGAALVGSQLLNAGMDAQSAAYFAREKADLARNRPKPTGASVTKAYESYERPDGWGVSLLEPLSKAYYGDDMEYGRQREIGRNQALMAGGGLAAMGAAPFLYRRVYNGPEKDVIRGARKTAFARPRAKGKAAGAAALLLGGGGLLAGSRYHGRERRETWE